MSNPVLVEVTRGNRVESRHRGAVAVIDGAGKTVFSIGDIDSPVFPRSACKAMQALPLVESGAADAYGFGNRELALSASSHSGEPEHAALAGAMLKAAGRSEADLECGAHWSFEQKVLIAQARTLDRPGALHNNCSGKHAGFVCAACHQDQDPRGYVGYDHPLQAEIREAMADLTGSVIDRDNAGLDGCSIPTYAVPLRGLAHGFARMATGQSIGAARARASAATTSSRRRSIPASSMSCRSRSPRRRWNPASPAGRSACSAPLWPTAVIRSRSNAKMAPPAQPRAWSRQFWPAFSPRTWKSGIACWQWPTTPCATGMDLRWAPFARPLRLLFQFEAKQMLQRS